MANIICPKCSTENSAESIFCRACGHNISHFATKKCPHCDEYNVVAANFCRFCGKQFSKESKRGKSIELPVIKDLTLGEKKYTIGSCITIKWIVEDATTVTINGQDATSRGFIQYNVLGNDIIELIADNNFGRVSKSIHLSPVPLPKITKFFTVSKRIAEGKEVKLVWQYTGKVSKVELQSSVSPAVSIPPGKNSIKVAPKANEQYTLVCYSCDPNVYDTKDLDLIVVKKVSILSFEADKQKTIETEAITLRWNVKGATKIILYPMGLDVTNDSAHKACPNRTTEYRLEATNGLTTVSKSVEVAVIPLPKLTYTMPAFTEYISIPQVPINLEDLVKAIPEIEIDKWLNDVQQEVRRSKKNKVIDRLKRLIRLK